MTPTLVTGATGFVGGAIAARLLADGREIRVLARRPEAAAGLAVAGADVVEGDVRDPAAVETAARGCDVVYHIAGVNELCVRDAGPMFAANVEGTRTVIRAAALTGVRRVVYTSSAATIGEPTGVRADEDTPHRGSFLSQYERSKHAAERVALDEARRLGVELVSVNPSSVQGPGRTRGTGRLVLAYANGRLRAIVDSRLSLVDVDDCTDGHLLAEARGAPGRRYLLSGATVTTREAMALVARVTGVEQRVAVLPPPVALAGAAAAEAASRARRRPPPVCREMVRTLLHGHDYDGSRAERELGLRYTPLEDTVRRTLRWYADQGLVTRPLPGLDRHA